MRGIYIAATAALVTGAYSHQNHGHQHAHAHKARQASSNEVIATAETDNAACAQECTTYWQYEWEGKTITVDAPSTSSASPAMVTVSVPVVPLQSSVNSPALTSSAPDACVVACNTAYNECRGASDSNKSACASAYASCLGYSPYGADGSLITPTICSVLVSSTAASTPYAQLSTTSAKASNSTTATSVASYLESTIASSTPVETTTNLPVFSTYVPAEPQPTPVVSTIETPGIYTIPATTVTISKTTTVCGATTTFVPAGPVTYGGVVTIVTTSTTVVCPYAAEETNTGIVTQVVKTTTYVCPSAGTYTPVPQTTTEVNNGTIIVFPTPIVYTPGIYTAPESVVTATKTNYVYYCPLSAAQITSSTSTPASPVAITQTTVETSSTSETPVIVASTTPAPVVIPSTTAIPVEPTTTAIPTQETTSSVVEEPSTSSSTPASVATGTLGAKGDQWAMTYTPYANSGECKTREEVASDIASIATKGFAAVRLYSTDCSGLENIGDACVDNGLKMILGLFIDVKGIAGAAEQVTALAAFDHWSSVELVVIGNEAIFNGYCSATELAVFIATCRAAFKLVGYSGLVTTTETMSVWQNNADVLCAATDITGVNMHPFFNAAVSAETAGTFALESQKTAEALCPGHEARNLEIGWPTQGSCNGLACPGVAEQKTAIASILELTGSKSVIFSYQNDMWKAPGTYGCEQYWGVSDLF